MITVNYEDVKESIENLDESISLITTLDDINIAEAIDRIYMVKSYLQKTLESFEDMLESMEDYYEE